MRNVLFGVLSALGVLRGRSFCAFLLVAPIAGGAEFKAEKYTLDNGLTVILHEDRSLPLVTTNLWYRVGARNEQAGRSGFAHLFEHLMFMGTRRAPEGQFDQIMEAGGGSNNADTSLDRTNYFANGPSHLLPTLLWLDADRLEDLGAAMTAEKLDRQRDIVRNEIRQNVENSPYMRAYEASYRLLYPPGHPYHNAVYGTHADLESATVHDVKDFFATFYVPNNLSLVVAGDFDSAKVKPLIRDLFVTLPMGGVPAERKPEPVKLEGVIRATQLDKVQLPKVIFAYHSPPVYAPGDAEMDLTAAILGDGKNGRLYERLVVKAKVAVAVSAWNESAQFGSVFRVEVQTKPDANLTTVESIVDDEIGKLVKDGPTEAELKQRVAQTELRFVQGLQSLEARARILNQYENHFGDPNSLERDLDRYRKATLASVTEWSRKVITPDARVIIRVLPEATERQKSVRDEPPMAAGDAPFVPPPPQTFTLKNGMNVFVFRRDSAPIISVKVIFKVDGGVDVPGESGLGNIVASMLEEGAGNLGGPAFAAAMQSLGASFSTGAGPDSLAVSMTVLDRNFSPAMDLFVETMQSPMMRKGDFDKVKALQLDDLRQQTEEPTTVAANLGARFIFGEKHHYGWPSDGTVESVGKVTHARMKNRYQEICRFENASVVVAGNIDPETAAAVLEKTIGRWGATGEKVPKRSIEEMPKSEGLRLAIVDRPDAPQTVVRFFGPAPRYSDPARPRLRLVNSILGGSFTSRLNQNLREKHGYAYGAGSNFAMKPLAGYFVAAAEVKTEVTGEAVKELLTELGRLGTGDITGDELSKAQKTERTEIVHRFAALDGPVAVGSTLVETGTSWQRFREDLAGMDALTIAAANETAKIFVRPDRGVLVLVGDKASILKSLAETKDLKVPEPEEFDAVGKPVAGN